MMKLRYLATVSLIALMLGGCKSGSSSGGFVPTQAGPAWTIAYSPSMPPFNQSTFDFPQGVAGGGIDYVIRQQGAIQPGRTIKLVFALEGDGKCFATEGEASARVRLFMQRQGDGMMADEPYKRWWSKNFVELVSPGEYTLSEVVTPNRWTSVFAASGETVPEAFADCIANLQHVGFTFGGNFAGHGVYADGPVRFVLKSFTIT